LVRIFKRFFIFLKLALFIKPLVGHVGGANGFCSFIDPFFRVVWLFMSEGQSPVQNITLVMGVIGRVNKQLVLAPVAELLHEVFAFGAV
jgi:hypothetical protein